MIGLVNAIGAAEGARAQSVRDGAQRAEQDQTAKLLPIYSSFQAAAKVLQDTVESLEFTETNRERPPPKGEQSDRFDQVELDGQLHSSLGSLLDVTA